MPKTKVHYKVLFLLSTDCLGFCKKLAWSKEKL
jgi:hypothetical protein